MNLMKKKVMILVLMLQLGFLGTLFWFKGVKISLAIDPVDQIQDQIDELDKLKKMSEAATSNLENQVNDLDQRIKSAQAGINNAEHQAQELEQSIEEREEELSFQYGVFKERIVHQYKRARIFSPVMLIFSTPAASNLTKDLIYNTALQEKDNQLISSTSKDISQLHRDKKELEQTQIRLASMQETLDEQKKFFEKEIEGAKEYQETLSGKIDELSAKQQEIINARSGGFTASIGNSELADDFNASIKGFREKAPAGSFAVFSFGAHTHRKGMSQYGARGRAESGQDYQDILKAYYGKEAVKKDTGGTIKVGGHGELDFDSKYLYGIAEMPSSWHKEALKAQAVAARTYAYRYKKDNKEICTTEACQVYRSDKASNPPEAWKKAVDETKGMVLEDVVTYYASTHGGYASPIGWDTTDGKGGGDFFDKSYDKMGGSPWAYKSWYTKGYSVSSDKCGRSNPWLSGKELADIVNAALYRDDRVTPVTTSCWGGDPYSHEELRKKADGPSVVKGVSVTQSGGSTSKVKFQTDKGEITLSGSEFKTAFNLRAPGYLSIPQSSFAFFNIESK
jgi:peptidoglycan hydrolase-like amidase/F0F1-type ATP synthase membrane subunit b/b'